jgi:uncharacterized membrane protein YhhN
MVAGLVLGLAGDVALLGGKRGFVLGLAAFLLGHVAYLAGMAQLVAPRAWPGAAGPVALVPVAAAAVALAWLWPHLGALRPAVIGYVATIAAMVVAAIACAHAPAVPAANRVPLVAGAALCFASDLSVARDRFVGKAFANKAWGLPAYYAGQLLIAWSLALAS